VGVKLKDLEILYDAIKQNHLYAIANMQQQYGGVSATLSLCAASPFSSHNSVLISFPQMQLVNPAKQHLPVIML
jgi:hypothetical protein